jgi:hypothetical protein
MRDQLYSDPKAQLYLHTCIQLRIQLLKKLLHDKIRQEPVMRVFSLLTEGQYKAGLRMIIGDVELTTKYFTIIERLKGSKENFDLFEHNQQNNLREISQNITFNIVKTFAISELKRLKEVRLEDLQSIPKQDYISVNEEQKRIVDGLMEIYRDTGSIELNKDNFSFLIKEYVTCSNIAMMAKNIEISGGAKSQIDQLHSRAYNEIGGLISSQGDSLDWLSSIELRTNNDLNENLIKFIRESCHLGDHKALNTVTEKLGDNFGNLVRLIPNSAGSLHTEIISIEDIMKIIDRRIKRYDKPETQAKHGIWLGILRKFNSALIGKKPSADSLLQGSRNSSSLQRLSVSGDVPARSGPVGSARGASARGASAGLDGGAGLDGEPQAKR